jgi:hypothetical protein
MNKIAVFFFLISVVFAAQAQNLHVAVDGSDDTGDGTIENPYATITEASRYIQPGDTVFVHQGTYHNAHFGDGDIWKREDLATIKCDGAEDAVIVFMPFPGDSVTLEFDANHGVLIRRSSYVKFAGFVIKGIGDQITKEQVEDAWGLYKDSLGVVHDLAQEMGIDITDPNLLGQTLDKPETVGIQKPSYYNGSGLVALLSHHIILENNTIMWAVASGLRVQKSDYTTVVGNKIYYNTYRTSAGVGALTVAETQVLPEGDAFDGVKIKIIRNEVYQNENQIYSWAPSKSFIHFVIDEGSGIFLTRNNDTYDHGYMLIANNLSWLNGASGIVVHKTDRVYVEHNTVYDNGTTNGETAKPGGIGFNTTNDVTIRNNISWSKPNKFALGKVGGTNNNLVIDSNLLFNNYGAQSVVKNVNSGWFEANPQFVDVDNFDFHLQSNSSAIDRGFYPVMVTDDFAGNPRDSKPDIGAYEYDSAVSVINNDVKGRELLTAFPNPATGMVYINSVADISGRPTLYDVAGKTVKVRIEKFGNNRIRLDVTTLLPGIYFLNTNSGTVKIVKR